MPAAIRGLVGNTPLLEVRHPGGRRHRLLLKLEGQNPTGSIKDRACVQIISDLTESGRLKPGMTLLDASSGNMACSIAFWARVCGHPAVVVTNSKLTAEKRSFIRFFAAVIVEEGDFTIEGSRRCAQMAAAEPRRYVFMDQLHNWSNPLAHVRTTGPEILAAAPDVTMLVGSLGSGGSLLGTAQFLKERLQRLHVVAVQAAAGSRIPGTGAFVDGDHVTPFIRTGLDGGYFDEVVLVSEREAMEALLRCRDQGVFGGLQTGAVLHAAELAMAAAPSGCTAVALAGDSGWKNLERLMQEAGHGASLSPLAGEGWGGGF